jgi:hypothetical protein
MRYIAHLVQDGEGCDYVSKFRFRSTIVIPLSVDNIEDARAELIEIIKDYDGISLRNATLYEVSNTLELI